MTNRKYRKRRMRGSGATQILTGEKNLQALDQLKKPRKLQAPGTLAMRTLPSVHKAPIVGSGYMRGRQRGSGPVIPHYGRWGELVPPPISSRYDL